MDATNDDYRDRIIAQLQADKEELCRKLGKSNQQLLDAKKVFRQIEYKFKMDSDLPGRKSWGATAKLMANLAMIAANNISITINEGGA